MIFATVGTQLPFDRLLLGLESWALRNPEVPVLAQSGAHKLVLSQVKTVDRLGLPDFQAQFEAAKLIVAHAGMGTILAAAELGKPIILMPRRAAFKEHRNDHQMDTATEMARLSNVTVAEDTDALHQALDKAVSKGFACGTEVAAPASHGCEALIDEIRNFVWQDAPKTERGAPTARRAA
ncbi:glycosyltransferase [Shimia sp. SDUM112013]|uniref:glycosyltransferase n=1 Tax=Shimia sp. SDUM112013 TaxID=3136160 RepID=UPI0032EB5C82